MALRMVVVLMALAAGPLSAEGVAADLRGLSLRYEDGTSQRFLADGETIFIGRDGRQSMGHWRMQEGRYCSVWPPSDSWACYDLRMTGDRVGFVADDGSVTTGQVVASPGGPTGLY